MYAYAMVCAAQAVCDYALLCAEQCSASTLHPAFTLNCSVESQEE